MKIEYHRQFLKHFRQRILPYPKLKKRFEQRLRLRLEDTQSAVIKDHRLLGSKSEYRAFSLTGNIRVVYKVEGEVLRLYDVGSHSQVY